MAEPSTSSSQDKLPEELETMVKLTLCLLETLDSELNNGPLKSTSRVVVLLLKSESLKMKTEDQEDLLMSSSVQMLKLSKQ